jgi:N-dimethylarginine dimethylaminohydrolase
MSRKPIAVHHEWGALKEVIVGVPNVRLPSRLAKAPRKFLPEESIALIEANAGKALVDFDPELNQKFIAQVNELIGILEGRGIIVHQVRQHLPSEEAFLANLNDSVFQTFPRDPVLVVGNSVIETAMFEPNRRRERFAIRRAIAERITESDAVLVSMPQPEPFPADDDGNYGPGPFLEGGDVFLLGRDLYVGLTGNASNQAGIDWLQRYLGPGYRVHGVPMSDQFLHLDCVLATPRPGLAIICREGFVDGLPDFLEGWTLIDVSAEDAEGKLGCNGLVLDDSTMLVGADMPELAETLRAHGTEVITTPIDGIHWQGGGFRCWHHPLVRESSL